MAGLTAAGESVRVSSPVLGGRYLYWLHEDRGRRQFQIGRTAVRLRSPLEFSLRTLPGRVESIAVTRSIVYYANGHGVFRATDPTPRFAAGG